MALFCTVLVRNWSTQYSDQHSTLTNAVLWPTQYSDKRSTLANAVLWPTQYSDQRSTLTNAVLWQTQYSGQRSTLTNAVLWPVQYSWHSLQNNRMQSYVITMHQGSQGKVFQQLVMQETPGNFKPSSNRLQTVFKLSTSQPSTHDPQWNRVGWIHWKPMWCSEKTTVKGNVPMVHT